MKAIFRSNRTGDGAASYFYLLPAMVLVFVFLILPFFLAILYSFTDFNLLRPDDKHIIFFENYVNLLQDELFLKSLGNTIYFTVLVVPIQCSVALALALLANRKSKIKNLFRISYFSPVVTSMTVIAILWTILYRENGLINAILTSMGMEKQPFLRSAETAMNSIIGMSVWASGWLPDDAVPRGAAINLH